MRDRKKQRPETDWGWALLESRLHCDRCCMPSDVANQAVLASPRVTNHMHSMATTIKAGATQKMVL